MFFLDGFWDKVGGAIVDALRSLMLSLCDIIYKLIVFFFEIFMTLGNAQILSDITVSEFYTRVGLILGLFMIFRVTFSLIQYVINPDLMADKQKGLFNIVKRIIIVVVLLGTTRSIFNFAYDMQKQIIKSNVIPKIVTGKNINTSASSVDFAWYTFNAFYNFDKNYLESENRDEVAKSCYELNSGLIERDFKENHTLRYAYNCVNERREINTSSLETDQKYSTYIIDFDGHGILAVIVGLIILWMIIMYVIQVGVRVVQLGYLQLIAPIPIIGYLAPKGEDTLNKWFKQCVTTYLDFFIRVAILYFVVFIINFLTDTTSDNFKTFKESLGTFGESNLDLIIVIMILALLLFASKVPKLLKEVFPSLGGSGAASFDFGLNPKKVFNDTLAARAIGAVGGAVGAGASNAIHGYMNMRKAWKNNGVTMKKWSDLTETERETWKNNKNDYNRLRNEQIWKRIGKTAGAGGKGVFSVMGGQIGGAVAGLKTKDITKVGDAVKTANKNRQEREFKADAGYHWYNPLPAMEDKILEFSGDRTADEVKNRQKAMIESKKWDERLRKGEEIYKFVGGELEDKTNDRKQVKAGVFKHSEYIETWNKQNLAKSKVKEARSVVDQMQRAATAAYSDFSGTEEERKYRIAVAEQRLTNAAKNLSAAEGELEIAKGKHQKNQELFSDDKEIEDLFNEYSNTHKDPVDINKGVDTIVIPNNEQDSFEGGEHVSIDVLEQQVADAEKDYVIALGKGDKSAKEKYKKWKDLESQLDDLREKTKEEEEIENKKEQSKPQYTEEDLDEAEKKLKKMYRNEIKNSPQEITEQTNLVNRIKDFLNKNK